jgi:hypothetical protein
MIEFDSGVGLFDDAVGNFDDGGAVNATAEVSGVTSGVTFGEVIALGTNSAIATVEGIALNATVATVTAVGEVIKKGRKSNAKFLPFTARPVTIQRDGRAKVATQTLKSGFAEITATGTNNARANIRGLQLKTLCRIPNVDGIINPSDDEIIWLLAA